MRKISNGKKYDTETADLICSVSLNDGDAHLFRKKNGDYFLWAHEHHDEEIKLYFGRIVDISEMAAKQYCELALKVEEYEFFFGKVEE